MIRILLHSLSYLRVRRDGKVLVDFMYPGILALVGVGLLFWLAPPGIIAKSNGLADRLQLFASVLPGFFIAALGAIATVTNPTLDGYFDGEDAYLKETRNGVKIDMRLTRRRFLTLLFAYLCLASLALFSLCIFVLLVGHSIVSAVPSGIQISCKLMGAYCILFLFFQCISCTCLGLYYLGSRMHTP